MGLTRVTNKGLDPNDEFSFNGLNVTGVVTATSGVGTIILDPASNMLKLGNATMHRDSTTGDTIIMNNDGAYNPLRASKYLINTNTVIDSSRNINAGVVTATSFSGDGSNLSGIDATQIQTGNTSVQTVDTGSDGHVKINTEGTERVRINSAGNVGIGTDNPNTELEVFSDTFCDITINSARTSGNIGGINFRKGGAASGIMTAQFFVDTDGAYHFRSQGTEKFRIESGGNVGIGTDNPSSLLHLLGSSTQLNVQAPTGESQIRISSGGGSYRRILFVDSATTPTKNNFQIAQQEVDNSLHIGPSTAVGGFTFSGSTGLQVDASGRVITPSQPIFAAHDFSSAGALQNGMVYPFRWNSVDVNYGSHFNNSTGLYTAPVTGNYLVTSCYGRRATYSQWGSNYILVNGAIHTFGWTIPGTVTTQTYQSLTVSKIIPMVANDVMAVGYYTGYTAPFASTDDNSLSIYLVG